MPMRRMLTLALLGLTLAATPAPAPAQAQDAAPPETTTRAPRPQSFASPEAGFAALAAAIAAHDEAALLRLLGPGAARLIRSGDPAADRTARDSFTTAYQARQAIERPTADRAVLSIGADEWPLPIPMIRRGNAWRFDAREGTQELVDRRIGRNELDTIAALRAIAEAQVEYAGTAGRQGVWRSYARRFFSTPGSRDGLYWASEEGEPESPLGPLAAQASAGGHARARPGDAPRPFNGYFFRMLEAQGPDAPGGALDYLVNGRMIGGFAIIAYPASYGVSGIQSFMISHAGTVYQRDLGPQTSTAARAITAFDPGPGWVALGR